MKAALAVLLLAAAASAAETPAPQAPAKADAAGWSLAWSDEFDGPAGALPDPAKWTPDEGDSGFGNQELEYYCPPGSAKAPCDPKRPNAATDGRGRLVIAAQKDAAGKWTSARLKTAGLKTFQYGRIEARMRLPYGPGLWPAFWALGGDRAKIEWPDCGEIDVMENVPGDVPGGLGADTIKSTLHGPGYSGVHGVGKDLKLPRGGRVDDEFHAYGAVWSPGRVAFYVDDWRAPFFVATKKDLPKGAKWVFDKPFFLIMNLAVGGSWPKDPTPKTPDPARMLVDYVRVYRRAP
ncbi:MAG: glycoside hydrolase family 16 protein [Elusimicrobia bacterium]|nr:glycoside hydrolase family 16 protein [Elusimicrobiota bacterium]